MPLSRPSTPVERVFKNGTHWLMPEDNKKNLGINIAHAHMMLHFDARLKAIKTTRHQSIIHTIEQHIKECEDAFFDIVIAERNKQKSNILPWAHKIAETLLARPMESHVTQEAE